ncbi:hypothetical protein [Pseudokineococcus sp. 1T1Z-3]|uniref:hypothetical protein n=1 Tax=Pseudokineococcus sp. 1T1Z-3 TaxID=3132745 RepID=UPI00309C0BB3
MVGRALLPDAQALAHAGKDGRSLPPFGKRYSTAKLCEVMYAYELHRRMRSTGSARSAIAFDPGSVPETGLLRTMPPAAQRVARTRAVKWAMRRAGVTSSTASFAGQSLAGVAADPRLTEASGTYLQCKEGVLAPARSSVTSYDERLAAELWVASEALTSAT